MAPRAPDRRLAPRLDVVDRLDPPDPPEPLDVADPLEPLLAPPLDPFDPLDPPELLAPLDPPPPPADPELEPPQPATGDSESAGRTDRRKRVHGRTGMRTACHDVAGGGKNLRSGADLLLGEAARSPRGSRRRDARRVRGPCVSRGGRCCR